MQHWLHQHLFLIVRAHLCGGLAGTPGHISHHRVLDHVAAPQAAVSLHRDLPALARLAQLPVRKLWVDLHLPCSGFCVVLFCFDFFPQALLGALPGSCLRVLM